MLEIKEMFENMKRINDYVWGIYAFKDEKICNQLSSLQMNMMINKSITCGVDIANKLKKIGITSVNKALRELKINLIYKDEYKIPNKLILALYTTPNKITIMNDPIVKISKLLKTNDINDISEWDIKNLLIAHELFHHIEEKQKREIYTKKEKIEVKKLGFLKRSKRILVLSEIAAMSFSKELTGVKFNPFLLDILLFYGYNEQAAIELYNDVMTIFKKLLI